MDKKRKPKQSVPTSPAPAVVYAVCQWNNCVCEYGSTEGNAVSALFTTEQTAKQYLDFKGGHGYGHVVKMPVRTTMPSY